MHSNMMSPSQSVLMPTRKATAPTMGHSGSSNQLSHLPYSYAIKRGPTHIPHVVKLHPITNKMTEIVEEDVENNRIINASHSSQQPSTADGGKPLGFKRGDQASRGSNLKENDSLKKKMRV
jgi:hypothetical protein